MFEFNQKKKQNLSSFKFKKKLNSWFKFFCIFLLVLITCLLLSQSYNFANQSHHKYSENLIKLQRLDADFNQAILKSRYELYTSYDPLVSNLEAQQSLQEELRTIPKFINPKIKKELEIILDRINNLLEQKSSLSETFKSRNALLKNSLRYLPLLTNQLENKFDSQQTLDNLTPIQLANLRSNLNQLIRNLLLFNVVIEENIQANIESLTTQLSQLVIEYGLTDNDFPAQLVESHTNVILNTKPQVEQLTSRLITPLQEETKILESFLENEYQRIVIRTNIYRILTIVWFIFIMIFSYYLLLNRVSHSSPKFKKYQTQVKKISSLLNQLINNQSLNLDQATINDLNSLPQSELRNLAKNIIQLETNSQQKQKQEKIEASFAFLNARLSLLIRDDQPLLFDQQITDLQNLMADYLPTQHCHFINLETEDKQVHLWFKYTPNVNLSRLIKQIKELSTNHWQDNWRSSTDKVHDKCLWNDAYIITSCDGNSLVNNHRSKSIV